MPFVRITLLIMKCVIILDRSFHVPLCKRNKSQGSTSAHSSFKNKRTAVQPVYPVCKAHLHYTYEWLVWKNTPMGVLLQPSLKIPPCLIKTHPPHLRSVYQWLRPKVFKLGRIGCPLLHTEADERDDESCFRGIPSIESEVTFM